MINLSYIVSTKNRLPFLEILFGNFFTGLAADEEVVVVDGGSTDGSREYLQGLSEQGRIHQFICEADKNQAHGWNKALLLARGTVIKKIMDDDVFCISAIRTCKDFMLSQPQVDVLISNDLSASLRDHRIITESGRLRQYLEWKEGKVPSFTFGDVHMLIRRSSLALTGLYNPSFIMMDWEFSLRISYLKLNIAYYTGYNALSVTHDLTVSSQRDLKAVKDQGKRGAAFYEYAGDMADVSQWSKVKILLGKLLSPSEKSGDHSNDLDIKKIYNHYYSFLQAKNEGDFKFYLLSE